MLRYLQSGIDTQIQINRTNVPEGVFPTKETISDHFGIKRNTIQKKLDALQNGMEIMGSNVKIEELRRTKNTYDSTVHPFFLSLNLTEVYFLTVVLKKYFNNAVFQKVAEDIANDIFVQSSDYAKDFILEKAKKENLSFPIKNNHEKHGYRNEKIQKAKYLKSVGNAKIQYSDWGETPRDCNVFNYNLDKLTIEDCKTKQKQDLEIAKIISIESR